MGFPLRDGLGIGPMARLSTPKEGIAPSNDGIKHLGWRKGVFVNFSEYILLDFAHGVAWKFIDYD